MKQGGRAAHGEHGPDTPKAEKMKTHQNTVTYTRIAVRYVLECLIYELPQPIELLRPGLCTGGREANPLSSLSFPAAVR